MPPPGLAAREIQKRAVGTERGCHFNSFEGASEVTFRPGLHRHVKLVCPTASVTPCRRFSCREPPSRLELKERLVQGHRTKVCPPLMPTGLNWEHPKVPLGGSSANRSDVPRPWNCHDTAMREATAALRANCRHSVQSAARFPTRASNVRLAVGPRHLNRGREDLGKRTNRPVSGQVLV